MRHARSACRRALQTTDVHNSQHIWISDAFLAETYDRFSRSARCPRRYGSNVPGPLEAQRRLAKRRMMGAAGSLTPGLLPHMGTWFTDGPPKREDLYYRAPGQKDFEVIEITIDGQLLRDVWGRFVTWTSSLLDPPSVPVTEVNKAEDQPDPRHEAFHAFMKSTPKLSEVERYLLDSARNTLGTMHMSLFLDYIKTWDHPWLRSEGYINVLVKVIQAGLVDDKEMMSIISRLDSVAPSRKWSQNVYRRITCAAYESPTTSNKLAVLQHLIRRILSSDSSPDAASSTDNWKLHRFVHDMIDHLQANIAVCDLDFRSSYILTRLARIYSPDSSEVSATRIAKALEVEYIIQYLEREDEMKRLELIVAVTRSINRKHPAQLLQAWMQCLQQVLESDFWDFSLISLDQNQIATQGTSRSSDVHSLQASTLRRVYAALATHFSYQELSDHFLWLGPLRAAHAIALFWYPAAVNDLRTFNPPSLGSVLDVNNAYHKALIKATKHRKPRGVADCYALLLATFIDHGVLSKTYQANMLQFVAQLYGEQKVIRMLKTLRQRGLRLYPGPLQALISKTVTENPRMAHDMHKAHPVWPSRVPQLLISLINDGQTAPSDIFKLLKDKEGKSLLHTAEGRKARSYLVHEMATEFAAQEKYTANAAFGAAHQCYRYLSMNQIPILPAMTAALVEAGITRPLEEGITVPGERYNWILDMVKRVEGEANAARIDTAACETRLQSIDKHEQVSQTKARDRALALRKARKLPLESSVPSHLFEKAEARGIGREEVIVQYHLDRAGAGRERRARLANAWKKSRKGGRYSQP